MSAERATAKAAELANIARTKLSAALNAETAQKMMNVASASARKASEAASSGAQRLPGRFTPFVQRMAFNGQVAAEIAKETARRERLAFPSSADWQRAKQQLVETASNWRQLRHLPQQITKESVARAAVTSIEVFGFFLVGEMIGRRSIVGYKLDERV